MNPESYPDPSAPLSPPMPAAGPVLPESTVRDLLAMAVCVWRLKGRLADPLTGGPKREMKEDEIRKALRNVESLYDSFLRLGLEIIDRTGETFDYGLPEKVVSARPQGGLSKELVIETLRPTLKWHDHLFPGEVEIATPPTTH